MLAFGCHHSADKEKSDIAGIVPQSDSGGEYPAMEARYTSWPDPDTLLIYIDGSRYKVSSRGEVVAPDGNVSFYIKNEAKNGTASGESASDGNVSFYIKNEGRIETLYFVQKGSSLFLFYTDATADGSASFVKRVDIKSGKTIWTSDVTGIAMGRPVIKGQFAYIGSFGFVGKLKLKNGQYDWKYSNLNVGGRFQKFQEIVFPNAREAAFIAPHPFSLESDTVVINDLTGEIIRMN